MTTSRRAVSTVGGFALAVLVFGGGNSAAAEQQRMLATCLPASQRTGPVGCWIMAQESLGALPGTSVFCT
jgi:hypothetical protein